MDQVPIIVLVVLLLAAVIAIAWWQGPPSAFAALRRAVRGTRLPNLFRRRLTRAWYASRGRSGMLVL